MKQELRTRTRVSVGKLMARVSAGDREIEAEVKNVSLKGILLTPALPLAQGDACGIEIALAPDIRIKVEGIVIRSGEATTAVDFTSVHPDGFGHLRRLVRLHAEDPDVIDQEMGTPAFS